MLFEPGHIPVIIQDEQVTDLIEANLLANLLRKSLHHLNAVDRQANIDLGGKLVADAAGAEAG